MPDDDDFDTAGRNAFARRRVAIALGVDECPEDAEVEMSIDQEGTCRVVGSVVVPGCIPSIDVKVRIT